MSTSPKDTLSSPNPRNNIAGKVFGRWTVLYKVPGTGPSKWLCRCQCGEEKDVPASNLKSGASKSCGCLREELLSLAPGESQANRKLSAKLKDQTPPRKEQKSKAQKKYLLSDKAVLAYFSRWAKKRKRPVALSDTEVLELRKLPCHKCGREIQGVGIGFTIINTRKLVTRENVQSTCGTCKLVKSKDKFDPIAFAQQVLRRFWKRSPSAAIALISARKARGLYQCAKCLELFKKTDIDVDHIQPAVDPEEGWQTLDSFCVRLFCDESNLQALCKPCHRLKTGAEQVIREQNKVAKKT